MVFDTGSCRPHSLCHPSYYYIIQFDWAAMHSKGTGEQKYCLHFWYCDLISMHMMSSPWFPLFHADVSTMQRLSTKHISGWKYTFFTPTILQGQDCYVKWYPLAWFWSSHDLDLHVTFTLTFTLFWPSHHLYLLMTFILVWPALHMTLTFW
jgi:hypothetical protein